MLASRGYTVLQVNFRGSGGFGKKFEDAGHMEWDDKMIEDLAKAARWAMGRDDIDQERVCAYGGSYGAYASYMLAVREPEMLRCVIGYVGVYDLNIIYSTGDVPKSWGGAGYLERMIRRETAELDEFSPTMHATCIKVTAMLIRGEDDIRAPIEHVYAMLDALEEVGKDPKWPEIDDSGHGAGSLKNRLELYEGLLGFLDSNLM